MKRVRWLLITVGVAMSFYFFVLIPVLEYEARAYFEDAKNCLVRNFHDPEVQCTMFDANGNVILPWWLKVYDRITYRPLIR